MKRNILLSALIFSCLLEVPVILYGQDIHFTRFMKSECYLNPAKTGDFEGEWRISDHYRTQWFTVASPFSTNLISLDSRISLMKNNAGFGLLVIQDGSGEARLTATKLMASLAYGFTSGLHQFRFGIQAGYTAKNFAFSDATWPDQYNKNTGYFDPTVPTVYPVQGNQIEYTDIHAGFQWNNESSKFQPQAGLSVFHLNRPGESFFGNNNQLPLRYLLHGKMNFALKKTHTLSPELMYTFTDKASELLWGADLLFPLSGNSINATGLYSGLYFRNGFGRNMDAFALAFGMLFPLLDAGLSYDFNISSLHKASSYQGALEFYVIYRIYSGKKQKTSIPCIRF